MKAVYSPCVEPLEYRFNSVPKVLPPNEIAVLPTNEARHVVNLFHGFGVCFIRRDPTNSIVESNMMKAAKMLWEKGNKHWAEQVVLDWHLETKKRREAGIEVEEPADVQIARKFLKMYADGERAPQPEEIPEPPKLIVAVEQPTPPPPPPPPKKVTPKPVVKPSKPEPAAKSQKKGGKMGKLFRGSGAVLLALFLPALAGAQELRTANAAYLYDVDAVDRTYCVLTGERGDPFASPIAVAGKIQTSGSSTTVTEVTTGDNPFDTLAVGDIILVDKGTGGIDKVAITAKASAASITVDTAVDWSLGYSFRYYDLACGTAATSGWIPVGAYETIHLAISFDQGDIGGLDTALECKYGDLGGLTVQVYPGSASTCGFGTLNTNVCTFTSTTFPSNHIGYSIGNNGFVSCRVALNYRTSDTSDVGTNREAVNAVLSLTRSR